MNQAMLRSSITDVLQTLDYREREILRLRYGLADGHTYTLQEIGRMFSVTRERVRQIEAEAIVKLQRPGPSRKLAGYLDWPTPPLSNIDFASQRDRHGRESVTVGRDRLGSDPRGPASGNPGPVAAFSAWGTKTARHGGITGLCLGVLAENQWCPLDAPDLLHHPGNSG